MESFWQPFVQQVYWCHFSDSILKLRYVHFFGHNAIKHLRLQYSVNSGFFMYWEPQKLSPITPLPLLWHILHTETTLVKSLRGEPDRSRNCPRFWTSSSEGDSELMKHAFEGRQATSPSPSSVDFTFSISLPSVCFSPSLTCYYFIQTNIIFLFYG